MLLHNLQHPGQPLCNPPVQMSIALRLRTPDSGQALSASAWWTVVALDGKGHEGRHCTVLFTAGNTGPVTVFMDTCLQSYCDCSLQPFWASFSSLNGTRTVSPSPEGILLPPLAPAKIFWCPPPATKAWPHKVQWKQVFGGGHHLLLMDLRSRWMMGTGASLCR